MDWGDDLYIKRIQRKGADGPLRIFFDNPLYQLIVVDYDSVIPFGYLAHYICLEWKGTVMNKLQVVVIFCFTVIGHSLAIAQGLSMGQQNDMRNIIRSEQQMQRNIEANREKAAAQQKDLRALTGEQRKDMERELADTPVTHSRDTTAMIKRNEIRQKYQGRALQNEYQTEQQAKSPRDPSAQATGGYVEQKQAHAVIPSSDEVDAIRMDREKKAAILQKNKEALSRSSTASCLIKPVMSDAEIAACR